MKSLALWEICSCPPCKKCNFRHQRFRPPS